MIAHVICIRCRGRYGQHREPCPPTEPLPETAAPAFYCPEVPTSDGHLEELLKRSIEQAGKLPEGFTGS